MEANSRRGLKWIIAGLIGVLGLTVLVAGRADAHPEHLIPEDGVMTVELVKHRSSWMRLMEIEKLNGPYKESEKPREEARDLVPTRTKRPTTPLPPAEIRALIEIYFPASEVDAALCVSWFESRWNPNAKNPRSTAAGLFQFLRATWNRAATALGLPSYTAGGPYDPHDATRAAAWLQARGTGWRQWAVHSSCGV